MSYFIKWTLIQYEIHTRNMFVCSKLWPFFFVLTRVVRIYSCVPWLWLARPTDWLLFVWSCIFGFWNGAKRSEPTMKCMLCFQKSIRSLSLDRRKSSVSSISTSIPFISFHFISYGVPNMLNHCLSYYLNTFLFFFVMHNVIEHSQLI